MLPWKPWRPNTDSGVERANPMRNVGRGPRNVELFFVEMSDF